MWVGYYSLLLIVFISINLPSMDLARERAILFFILCPILSQRSRLNPKSLTEPSSTEIKMTSLT